MKLTALLLAVLLIVGLASCKGKQECPVSDDRLSADGTTCYKIIAEQQTWGNANQRCVSEGGALVQVDSEATKTELASFFGKPNVWIGLSDIAYEGRFEWTVGGALGAYSNWEGNEGGVSTKAENNCVVATNDWKWYARTCDGTDDRDFRDFICEYRACPDGTSDCDAYRRCVISGGAWDAGMETCTCHGGAILTDKTCTCAEGSVWDGSACRTRACPDGVRHLSADGTTCYKIFLGIQATWGNSNQRCVSEGGALVQVDSEATKTELALFFGKPNVWIGLSDIAYEGRFEWTVGGALGAYNNWEGNEGGESTDQDCVVATNDWKWYARDCDQTGRDFICEYSACHDGASLNLVTLECECPGFAQYNTSSFRCQCLGDSEVWDEVLGSCVCEEEMFRDAVQGNRCTPCESACEEGFNQTTSCTQTTDRECDLCRAGYYCVGGVPTACEAPEGRFCPAGYTFNNIARRSAALQGIPCPEGYFCPGETADKVPCTADVGFYCPAVFTPGAGGSLELGLAGRRCPPSMFCAGNISQPTPVAFSICNLAQSCGSSTNTSCGTTQSTFFKYNDPPAWFALDADAETCMKSANAKNDPNPQWLRVELSTVQLVGTVRFVSAGAASDFEVLVSVQDAAPAGALNPSVGAELPDGAESCTVKGTATAGVWEAECSGATKGQYVFIRRASAREVLEVCDMEVFKHHCRPAGEAVLCGVGEQPAPCKESQACPGCVPCPAGTYSDKEGPYECTVCPGHSLYGENPYSPPGSTSVFQCEGDAHLDGTSTFEVDTVTFNQTIDAWEIVVDIEIARRIQINGLSTIFMSKGGDDIKKTDKTFQAKNFPCRADTSRAAGSDLSTGLSETVCCLQGMRQDYLMTKIFRDFSDSLDLVAANDVCDGDGSVVDGKTTGSNMLVNSDLAVVGEGTFMVNTDGNSYANSITVEPLVHPDDEARRSHESYTGVQRAKITIPDAELYKISKSASNPDDKGNLTDSRELFIGLLDMLPTGTRVVDSASQQISIVLTRTQYGTFAAYGRQDIDYDFISFLNARAHKVISQTEEKNSRRDLINDQYYAEISFVYDDRLQPVNATGAVVLDTVTVNNAPSCFEGSSSDFQDVVGQDCGPKDLPWGAEYCPQVTIPDDHLGRLYIPLNSADLNANVMHIEFALWFTDMGGRNDRVTLAMDLVVEDFVTWCDAASGSVELAERVIPRIIVGTESDSPPRLTGWNSMADTQPFATGAETLQDGLVTMILDLNETEGLDDNLEVFFEDVLVIHVNPGSQPDVNQIKHAMNDDNPSPKYMPTYNYDPDKRDAWLHIPPALKTDCPAEDATTSFFGCVHKHILRNKVITNETDAYIVGSSPPPAAGAQDFVETMLGDGTASVAARELGRDFEQYLMTTEGVTGSSPKSIGLWINPGHKWGGVTTNSEYSLSKHLIIHVLFGVRSGIDGSERRMLLSTNGDGTTSMVRTLESNVNAATLVESVMDDVVAIEVEARLALSAEEACLPLASLRAICSERLEAAVEPHASKVERVECVSVQVENANCDGTRRADAAPVALVDAVIALAKSESAFLDIDAVVASGSVLGMKKTAGRTFPSAEGETVTPEGEVEGGDKASDKDSGSGSGSSTVIIGAAAGAAVGVVLVAFGAWKASKKCNAPTEPLTEVVSSCVVEPVSEKARIENLLFQVQRQ